LRVWRVTLNVECDDLADDISESLIVGVVDDKLNGELISARFGFDMVAWGEEELKKIVTLLSQE
jgi:hypothetical protein